MQKKLFIFSILFSLSFIAAKTSAQITGHLLPAKVIDGDTIAMIRLPEVVIYGKMTSRMKRWYNHNEKLVRNVKKVMPYAKEAAIRLQKIDKVMASLPTEQQRKNYYQQSEKELRDEFESDLRKMTFSQGKLLLKLIDRECGKTTFSILQEYRSSFTAMFWQSFARIFGYNLKAGYDKDQDYDIEMVIKMLGYE